jgi:hypothetical protein
MLFVINCLSSVISGLQINDSRELSDKKTIDGDLKIMKTSTVIDEFQISGYHVKGNLIIECVNCTSRSKGVPHIDISDNWVEGDIIFIWPGAVGIHLRIYSNPIVYGNISVLVFGVYTDDEIVVEVFDNGENIMDSSKNQAVGNIVVTLFDNFCMPMAVVISHNWVHYTITADVHPGDQINAGLIAVSDNHVGETLNVNFTENDVDRLLIVGVKNNTIGNDLHIDLSNNYHLGWIEYLVACSVYIDIINNHCVKKNTYNTVFVNGNLHYGVPFYTNFTDNGFGGDFSVSIMDNLNVANIGDMKNRFYNNKCDMLMNILVQDNIGYPMLKDYAVGNTASDSSPTIDLQHTEENTGNIQQNPQTVGSDTDHDGLTDAYEKMIGVDPNNADTDSDGFLDGWDDANGNKGWDAGDGTWKNPPEKYGEIGDPLQEVEVSKHRGSIGTLFAGEDDLPNPINKDIYIEIDFLEGCVITPDVLKPVQTIFAKHCIRLHIDMGWDPGPAGGATGGNVFAGGWVRNGRNYLFFDTARPRRIEQPLPWASNDFYDFKTGLTTLKPSEYFNGGKIGAREDIFHYVLFVHYYAYRNKTHPLQMNYRNAACGVGEFGRFVGFGDDFVVCYDNHLEGGHLNVTDLRDTFMHELGHNLELDHSWENGTPPMGFDPDPAVNPWPGRENLTDTVMYWSGGVKLDYLRAEWARVNLSAVCDGTKMFYS